MGGGASKTGAAQAQKVVVRSRLEDTDPPPEAEAWDDADGDAPAAAGGPVVANAAPSGLDHEAGGLSSAAPTPLPCAPDALEGPPPQAASPAPPLEPAEAEALGMEVLSVGEPSPRSVSQAAPPARSDNAEDADGSVMSVTAASLPSLRPITPKPIAEAPREPSFRQAIKEGYRQMAAEREAWLRSMAQEGFDADQDFCDDVDLEATGTSEQPLVGLCGKVLLERRALAANEAWDAPLKERSADVAEELKEWTQRICRKEWLPVTEEV